MDSTKKRLKAPPFWGGVGVGLLLLTFSFNLRAQSFFSDLFGQSAKQKRYYLQQIAAYQAFENELKQGYNVVTKGLGGIKNITAGELGQHNTYYSSRSAVSTAVKDNSQVQDIETWQSGIITAFDTGFPGLTNGELRYVQQVKTGILDACDADITALRNLLLADELRLTDGERLQRLAKVHADMLDNYRFTQNFINRVHLLAAQRQHETDNILTIQKLYEIK